MCIKGAAVCRLYSKQLYSGVRQLRYVVANGKLPVIEEALNIYMTLQSVLCWHMVRNVIAREFEVDSARLAAGQ